MAKERYVTRRVIDSKTYDIYEMKGTNLIKLDTIEAKGKLSETELAKQYGVDKIVIDLVSEKKSVYGVPVSKFMEIAVLMNEKGDDTADTNKDEQEQ